ncbi:GNAT family N-acetyltransferase [Beggiatoa alba]|nr:GNAT family N-acetyltransferase [Beggiatoa alba]
MKSTLLRKIKSAGRTYRDHGLGALTREIAEKIIDVSEFIVMRRDMLMDSPESDCKLQFELKRIDNATFESFKEKSNPFPRHFEYHSEYGQRYCYGVYVGDEIGALMWILFREDNDKCVNTWRYLLSDEARIADVWAHPKYRGTGLIHTAMERMINFVGSLGIRYTYVFTWQGNERAIHVYQRRGFTIIGNVWNIRWTSSRPGGGIHFRQKIVRDPIAVEWLRTQIILPDLIP